MARSTSTYAGDYASGESRILVDAESITQALDEVFDQAIVFHGFTTYMRDYEVIVFATADPCTGIQPEHVRYLFTHCVRATITTAVRRDVWPNSLDERLTSFEQFEADEDLDGYVWGVSWQGLYPGAQLQGDTPETAEWSRDVGIPFHQVRIETNGHNIELVFSTLRVTVLQPGYTPFVTPGDGPDFKFPLE